MSRPKAEKTFDCLAYKDRVQEEIHQEIKGLTPEQQIEYFNRHAEAGPFAGWWRKIRATRTERGHTYY